ncbi:MAG: transglycosylase SLT domain-containing protein [Bacteroidota bacterium]
MSRVRRILVLFLCPVAFAYAQRQSFSTKYDDQFRKYSKRYFGVGFDWRLFKAQALAESNLSPDASSRVGARGIMQLMPSTFREIQSKNPEFERVDDPHWNIAAGIYYNRQLWTKFHEQENHTERIKFTFGSYNAGPARIFQAQSKAEDDSLDSHIWDNVAAVAPKVRNWRYRETLAYVRRIDSLHTMLRSPEER